MAILVEYFDFIDHLGPLTLRFTTVMALRINCLIASSQLLLVPPTVPILVCVAMVNRGILKASANGTLQIYFPLLAVSSGCAEGAVRLAGGKNLMEGRVEVCHNETWWAVSGSSWDFRDATVVCKHLHYSANCKLNKSVLLNVSDDSNCMFFIFRGNPFVHCILWERQCHNTGSGFWMYW